jgi:oligopeptide transport system ATP-binding protein
MSSGPALLEFDDARKSFALGRDWKRHFQMRHLVALDGVSLTVEQGEILGLVGESGSGKSTLAQVAVGLARLTGGSARYRGAEIARLGGVELRSFRRRMQMVFQDTNASFNPRKTVARTLRETLALRGVARPQRLDRAAALLDMVGLGGFALSRYPHQLSGGQRQRAAIARALAMEPEFLLADEPVASLDVSLQAQIVNLLLRLRADLGLTMLFISHDLALVNHISTRVAVMYAGRIVEIGRPEEVLRRPAHPYTRALIDAVPKGIGGRARPHDPARGAPPDPAALPPGCRFAARCPQVMPVCRLHYPASTRLSTSHAAECHLLAPARSG